MRKIKIAILSLSATETIYRLILVLAVAVSLYIHRNTLTDMFHGSYAVDAFLHLTMPTIGAFNGIGR